MLGFSRLRAPAAADSGVDEMLCTMGGPYTGERTPWSNVTALAELGPALAARGTATMDVCAAPEGSVELGTALIVAGAAPTAAGTAPGGGGSQML